MLAGHVLGAAWYLLSIERYTHCWKFKCTEEHGPPKWWEQLPTRWVIVLLCFTSFLLCHMDRANRSIARLPKSQEFNWKSAIVGLIQIFSFWGSVGQLPMQFPSRYFFATQTPLNCNDQKEDESSDPAHESRAIIPVSNETLSHHTPPLTNSRCLPLELEGLHEHYLSTCRVFKYQELQLATSNFSPGNLIGKGSSSRVYRGCLSDHKELAVKILKHSEEMLKKFILEIEIITSLHHKNIMSLFGFCFEGDNLLLVYDFLPRGSLEENLHGCKDPRAFGWNERYKIGVESQSWKLTSEKQHHCNWRSLQLATDGRQN
ncbi:hypothetical protein Nepgr_031414 [Nepenthes gracilis]|uniref:Protein kinase domain-containing protein n=1 Tax=Nepenthes gracilis TaxID=150966 RepID=A0AAD3TIG7_NEPGR|nr:hypothetical protein Nepgr_031414 [Nepenthes gracilis]